MEEVAMPVKKSNRTEIMVATVLKTMHGERWDELKTILTSKGLEAFIAATTLEEAKQIRDKVQQLRPSSTETPFNPHSEYHEVHEAPLFERLGKALRKGIEQATLLPWPPLYQEGFDA
tara:strand:- start:13406 stop:13759 length:354 start_codon:yes stop_codon:yes gene_type:complete